MENTKGQLVLEKYLDSKLFGAPEYYINHIGNSDMEVVFDDLTNETCLEIFKDVGFSRVDTVLMAWDDGYTKEDFLQALKFAIYNRMRKAADLERADLEREKKRGTDDE